MHVFVAGASGALGRPLVKQLVAAGHRVTGMTSGRPEVVMELGAEAAVANAFDPTEVKRVVMDASPDAIVNLLTRIPHTAYPMPARFKENNRLRTVGTRHLIDAASAAGGPRMLAESITFAFKGRSEENMKPLEGMGQFQTSIEAAVAKENMTLEYGGTVLRYGYFYGPGTTFEDAIPKALRRRTFPILGKGNGWWSLIHVDDAASATAAAIGLAAPGQIYNICDDEPILAKDALRLIAAAVGAKPPRHVPAVGPRFAVTYYNHMTGASNSKAKRELGWIPRYPTLKEGYESTIE